ncbi:MAG: hypothetical protein IPP01_10165 [Saprospiraceae bacterium]|nr:hypothetical protein [Saprospiraceae bacterium]
MFMTPAGYNETTPNTTTDANDSDADPATGNSPLTNLVSGESDQTIDAGIYRPATIGDYVWRDTDGDGIQDPTEVGINGVTVLLKNSVGATVATTVTGTTGTSPNITVTSGSTNQTIDAGLYQPASLGNYVWEDLNKNGIQEAGEPGVNGVAVLLKNSAGSTLQRQRTTINNPTTG